MIASLLCVGEDTPVPDLHTWLLLTLGTGAMLKIPTDSLFTLSMTVAESPRFASRCGESACSFAVRRNCAACEAASTLMQVSESEWGGEVIVLMFFAFSEKVLLSFPDFV